MLEAPTIAPITDEVLVQRARQRDSAAREELFQRHRNDAYRVAYRLLGNEHDALDVVQESLLKAFSRLADFDGRGGFRFWLLRIVSNSALDWGRSRKRKRTVPLDERTSDGDDRRRPGTAAATARPATGARRGAGTGSPPRSARPSSCSPSLG